jgi:hypothetical protein
MLATATEYENKTRLLNWDRLPETDAHSLSTSEDWWTMVMGGGIRGTIDQLDSETKERVQAKNLEFLRTNNIQALDSDVLYAIARS